ncbi:hypothetical protein CIG75_18885 [Tumebacillus algifaecis]|uniref:Antitoxin SocA-like Panacea domain-containing protein n=1 Tax=Tumebacillus algifaecis TaxID=1214604 RepID=A0A223D5F1_9BACL|nr:hypothetical protein CIG75_18885 [Tumebacillus algifaecis]
MTHKKLQKLCYYAYSWYLTLYKDKLINNRFEAWIHGPVDPGLYQEYKSFGWRPIPVVGSAPKFEDDVVSFLEDIWESYGDFTGDELEYLSHQETPWLAARAGLPATAACNTRLRDEVIREYYQRVYEEGQND